MKLLIYRNSFDDIADDLAARPEVEPIIMERDGRCVGADGAILGEPAPDAAWFSTALFLDEGGPMRAFATTMLASGTVRWVQSGAAGYEMPIFTRLLDAGVRLSINDASSVPIAEYVLAQVLACFQPAAERLAAQTERSWTRLPFREIAGTRWLVLGYGSIGQHVAERAGAFGASVVGIRRTPRPDPFAERVVGVDALEEEIGEADVFVICAAANESNAHIVDADLLARMKPDAVLVNVARGSLVDETALIEALDAGRPGMAVLDVFEEEPLPESSPLWLHPKVRATAHCSPFTEETIPRGNATFLEHLDAYLAGEPLRLEVKA